MVKGKKTTKKTSTVKKKTAPKAATKASNVSALPVVEKKMTLVGKLMAALKKLFTL